MELAIIGGGAAGMMAALTAAEWMEGTITLLERQTRLGRKLLATGNGRCNLSNLTCAPSHYHGGHPDFVRPALDAFGVTDTLAFFRQRGLLTIAEPDGKCYPYSDQANSVLDTLRLALDAAGVVVRTDWPVETIRPGKSGGFTLTGSAGSLWADRVILTAGGAAAPKLGGTKSGYQLAKTLGHKCTRLHPSLVQLNTDPTWPKSLKGVRADAVVKLLMGQELAAEEAGQVQFTDYGVSGPVIFQLSRLAVTADVPVLLSLDLLPHVSQEELVELLAQRQMLCPGLTLENLLTGMLHNRLGRTVIRYGGRKLGDAVMDLTRKNLTAIAKNIKDFRLPVTGDQGLEHAQVTAGGLDTSQFDPETLESRRCPGLYAAGEVLDVDGDCGGFNLQWAWSSGHLAGLLQHR